MEMHFSLLIAITLLLCNCCAANFWDYEPISIETFSSDESKANFSAHIERIERDYTLTGRLQIDFDVDETTMVDMIVYHSISGNVDDYSLQLWSIQKQTLEEFCNNFYKALVYKNLQTCSNIPVPEKIYPLPREIYNFNKCSANGKGMPEILPEGYYKIIFTFSGEVNFGFIIIAKVTTKPDLLG